MRDYNGNFVEKIFEVPWLLWRKYENKTRKKTQEAREKNNQYKKVKWDLQGNKNKG